jgi:ribonuclease BN (tRNA processing enzyme)
MGEIANMRVTLHGVQGSGATSMRLSERETAREITELQLLERIFDSIAGKAGGDSRLNCSVEELLGGPLGPATLREFRSRFTGNPPVSYGGWTTCVQVETAAGLDLVFDCGSGFRNCANDLQRKWADRPERQVHIFGSHSHRDHTEGFDQATVCFDPRNEIHIYGNRQFLFALDDQLGIFSRKVAAEQLGVHTPLYYELMPARFACHPIVIGKQTVDGLLPDVAGQAYAGNEPIVLGDTRVTPFELFHPAPCLGYCVETGGKKFVFATDHELRRGDDDSEADRRSRTAEDRLRQIGQGADFLYRDGQFMLAEYLGDKGIGDSAPLPRLDWGHSCYEDVVEMAEECDVAYTLIGHHDPNREWAERQWMDTAMARNVASGQPRIELAKAEAVIDL